LTAFRIKTLPIANNTKGAIDARLHHTFDNLSIYEENMSASKSRIVDTDMAASSSELVKKMILHSASISTLSQANQKAQVALKLVG